MAHSNHRKHTWCTLSHHIIGALVPVVCQYSVRYSTVWFGTVRLWYGMLRLEHIYGKIRYGFVTVPKAENCLFLAVRAILAHFFKI